MRLLITGSTGFIGSYVTRMLSKDHVVGILTRPTSDPWRIKDCLARVTRIDADLENPLELKALVADFKPDVVLHLAWDGVSNEYRNDEIQAENVIAAMNLLDASIEAGAKAWIGLGSQAEYASSDKKITESCPTTPTSLYGSAKLVTCSMAEEKAADAGLRFAWLRVFSTYGPADHSEWMIPYLIRSLLEGERPSLTEGEQVWDYLFVEDAAEAISLVVTDEDASGIYNIGSGKSQPLREIIELIRDQIDPALPLGFGELPYRKHQVMHLEADVEKIKNAVGWEPSTSITQGIAATIDWYKSRGVE